MAIYDKVSKHYFNRRKDKSRFDYNRDIEVPAILKLIGNVKNKTLLDMGCGFGDHAKKLSKKGAKKIIGFDISKKLIAIANKQNISNCKFEYGNLDKKLKYKNNSFDIVYSSLAIHYIKNLSQLFKEVNRVLKQGGIFVFSTGHPIADLIAQSPNHKIEIKRKGKKRITNCNYFNENKTIINLGGIGKMNMYPKTFEKLIKSALNNKFELIDYVDAKPIPSAKKYGPEKYKLTTTLPTFILFKFKKN